MVLCLCTSIQGMQHSSSESSSGNEMSSDECSGIEMEDVSTKAPPLVVVVPTPPVQPIATQVANQNVPVLPVAQLQTTQGHNTLLSIVHASKGNAVGLINKHPRAIVSCVVLILFAIGVTLLVELVPKSDCYYHPCS